MNDPAPVQYQTTFFDVPDVQEQPYSVRAPAPPSEGVWELASTAIGNGLIAYTWRSCPPASGVVVARICDVLNAWASGDLDAVTHALELVDEDLAPGALALWTALRPLLERFGEHATSPDVETRPVDREADTEPPTYEAAPAPTLLGHAAREGQS